MITIDTGMGRVFTVMASKGLDEANISLAGVIRGEVYIAPIYAAIPRETLDELIAALVTVRNEITPEGREDDATPLLDAAIARLNPRRHAILKGASKA